MYSPLQQITQTYKEQVDQVMTDHHLAMACRDVEELVVLGLGIFESFESLDARWRDGIRRNDPSFKLEDGYALQLVLNKMLSARAKLISVIDFLEQSGYEIDGATRLRNTEPRSFESRPLEVGFSEKEFNAIAATAGSDPVSDADDDL